MDVTGDFDWQLGKDGKAQKAHIVGFFMVIILINAF